MVDQALGGQRGRHPLVDEGDDLEDPFPLVGPGLTRSPTWTLAAGLTGAPLTRTWPARHASVDSDRVLNSRTAQSH